MKPVMMLPRLDAEKDTPVQILANFSGEDSPTPIPLLGNREILTRRKIGLLCSIQCPGDVILKTLNLIRELRDTDVCVVSGFHSPMEQECLNILMRGKCSIIKCYARSIANLRIPSDYRKPLDDGRLLVLSPFGEDCKKTAKRTTRIRNTLVAAISDVVFVPHASPGGNTEKLCEELISHGKPLYTFESEYNDGLMDKGAQPITIANELALPGQSDRKC
jgi:predicted Rossmann fold nucleotide-binding protein DprA/Smf involved in DNA uptake